MNKALLLSALMLSSGAAWAQYGIGTNAVHPSALFELNSNSKGFLPPRMSFAQRDALTATAADGLIVYQNNTSGSSLPGLYVFSDGSWSAASASALAGSGLTENGGRLDLGGTLDQNTTLNAGSNRLSVVGSSDAPEGLLEVLNTASSLTTGTSVASQAVTDYSGTEATGSFAGVTMGSNSISVSTSTDFEAHGAFNDARASGGGAASGGAFRALGTSSVATASGTTAAGGAGDVIIGSSSATNFEGVSGNWNGVAVDGYTNFGGTTTGRTAGGVFNGRGGNTEIGVIGTLDNYTYETFLDYPALAGMHIGVVAANRNAPANNQFALWGIGAVRLTGLTGTGSSLVSIDPATGDLGTATSLSDAQVADNLTVNDGTITATPITNSAINNSQIGATTPASARVTTLNITGVQDFTDNNDAITNGGLSIGDVYRTGDVLKIVH